MANLPALTPTTFAEAMEFAETLAKSTMVPPAFQRNPANILLAVQWGAELGMPPLQALQSIAVINGKPAVYGDAMLALVRGSPLCEDVIERIEGEGENRVAVCEARRKGKAPVFGRFSIANAKQAKLWGKAGPWTEYPGRMMQMRARAFALRDAFPDVLRGIIAAEEAADMPRQAKDVTPEQTVAADLDSFADVAPRPNQGEIDMGLEPDPDTQERDHIPDAAMGVEIGDAASAASGEASEQVRPVTGARIETVPLVTIEAIKPARVGRAWDWPGYADAVLKTARDLPRDHFGAFRAANGPMLNSLRMSNRQEWSRVQQALADLERGDEAPLV